MNEKEVKALKTLDVASDLEKNFIDEYMVNGFNKMAAGQAIKPDSSYVAVNKWVERAFNKPAVKQYYNEKVAALRAENHIEHVMILRELMSFAYSDVTTFIGLTMEEIKQLPADIRRCIGSIDTVTKTWLGTDKQVVKEVTVKIKLIDKLKAIDMISRHIDFFNADNQSKGGTIDLTKATDDQLNAVLQLIQSQKQLT